MRAVLMTLLAALLPACGNKGALYLAEPTSPPPAALETPEESAQEEKSVKPPDDPS